MGQKVGKFFKKLSGQKDKKIIIIGLDGAGKTTLLYRLKLGKVNDTVPTIGFNVETIEHKKLTLNCWDVGGQDKIRDMWKHYYRDTNGIVFVIDASDTDRIDGSRGEKNHAKKELHQLLEGAELKEANLLIYSNKQDVEDTLTDEEIEEALALDKIVDRKWKIVPCSAKTGEGLMEGIEWISEMIVEQSKKKKK